MKKFLFSIACIICVYAAHAQYDLGIATSNWSGIYALGLNPANIADSRERFVVDVASLGGGANNNLGYINSKGGLISAINNGNTNNLFSYSNNSQFSLLAPYGEVHLPGIMLSLNPKNSIALTTDVRGMNQFNNFNQSLYRTITDPTYAPNGNLDLTSNNFNYTAQVWSEVGFSYAGVILDQKENEIKVGATVRYLGGIGYIGLKGHNLNAQYQSGTDSLVVKNSDLEFASNIVSTRSAVLNGVSNQSLLSEFFGAKDGSGMGGDIGIVYDYMPDYERDYYEQENGKIKTDRSKNRYKLRLSASVMDIGAITYKAANNSNAEITGNGSISGTDFSNNVHTFDEFRSYAVSHGFTADTSHQNTKVYMPTTLRVGADYHIYKWFYVNGTYIANLANRQNFGNSYYNQLTVTPRFDTKLISVGLPITYDALSQTMKMGIGVRVAGFVVGSDDMLGLIASHQSGANFYVGGFVPFDKKRPKGLKMPPSSKGPEPVIEPGSDTTKKTEEEDEHSFNYPARRLFQKDAETRTAVKVACCDAGFLEMYFLDEGDKEYAEKALDWHI